MSLMDEGGPFKGPVAMAATMTLRDYFAAKALQGMCAATEGWIGSQDYAEVARRCYGLADAMLAEREASR